MTIKDFGTQEIAHFKPQKQLELHERYQQLSIQRSSFYNTIRSYRLYFNSKYIFM